MEIDQLRDCEQTWDSLQRYINIFSSKYGYTNIEYTLQEKKPYLYSCMVKNSSSHPNI